MIFVIFTLSLYAPCKLLHTSLHRNKNTFYRSDLRLNKLSCYYIVISDSSHVEFTDWTLLTAVDYDG